MIENLNALIRKKDVPNIYILFIILLLATFLEMLGIGSIPVFAMLITNPDGLFNYLPDSSNFNFIVEMDQKKLMLFGAILLLTVFIIKNLFLALMNYFQAFVIKELKINTYKRLFKLYINSNYYFEQI